jgi:hypothetical protein
MLQCSAYCSEAFAKYVGRSSNVPDDFHDVLWASLIEKVVRTMELENIPLSKRFSDWKNFWESGNGGGSNVQTARSLEQPSARSVGRLSQ